MADAGKRPEFLKPCLEKQVPVEAGHRKGQLKRIGPGKTPRKLPPKGEDAEPALHTLPAGGNKFLTEPDSVVAEGIKADNFPIDIPGYQ